jgi:hypothetical protein
MAGGICHGDSACGETRSCPGCERDWRVGGVGGGIRSPAEQGAGAGRVAVRVLRTGVDLGRPARSFEQFTADYAAAFS